MSITTKVEEALIERQSISLSYGEWHELADFYPTNFIWSGIDPREPILHAYAGRPVIMLPTRVVIWDCCPWCKTTLLPKPGLFDYWLCRQCGGDII